MTPQRRKRAHLESMELVLSSVDSICLTDGSRAGYLRFKALYEALNRDEKVSLLGILENSQTVYIKEKFANKENVTVPKIGTFIIKPFAYIREEIKAKYTEPEERKEKLMEARREYYLRKIEEYKEAKEIE